MSSFDLIKGFPDFLDRDYKKILYCLKKTTFIFLDFGSKETVLISTLMHGNEDSGFFACVDKLREIKNQTFPFNILFFFGNVRAAQYEKPFTYRYLDGQKDFNRVWTFDKTQTSKDITKFLKTFRFKAHIDIHNNTGKSPFYVIITNEKKKTLDLASIFSDKWVCFQYDHSSFSVFMASLCTSITIEAGKVDMPESYKNAKFCIDKFLDYCAGKEVKRFKLKEFYVNQRSVKMKPGLSFGFNGGKFSMGRGLELLNFKKLPAGYVLGSAKEMPIFVIERGRDITKEFFELKNNKVVAKKDLIPIMITSHLDNIKRDLFFYIVDKAK